MFSADLKSDTLKGLVNIISTLIDEVKFTITPEGMTLKAVDAAHVAMIEMEVEKCAFDKYEAEDCEMMFCMHEEKVGLKAFGFSEESVSDELCNPAYFCPHGRTERVYRFSGGKGSKFGYELYI